MKFADRMSLLGTENAFEVLAQVKKLEAEGRQIVSFAIGEPDFDTPENIKVKGQSAIDQNYTHYAPSAGIMELREAVANHVSKMNGITVGPENVVITPGAKPIIFHTILSLVNPGDEVIYPNPGFPIYESVVRFVGGKAVPVALREQRGFSLDPEELESKITEKTKLLIINSPQNPTGGIIAEQDLQKIAELAVKHDLWVLSDEIYSELIYEGEFKSISSFPGMKERTIILNGFSKTYAMTGWRIGYGVMCQPLAELMARLVTNSDSCVATFTQMAAVEALTGPQTAVQEMVQELKQRRDVIVNRINQIPGFSCLTPKGAFYVYANVTKACQMLGLPSSRELQQKLLLEGNVAVLPHTSFGSRNEGDSEEYVRFSFATSLENIHEGLDRIGRVMETVKSS
ncbi:pyridoxal phosphate-dependent aminotransferase [Ammoniphilus resinae]|uniref:Aminotransferase n=1 Tax=Ammoniphilus resinae TaxID=861532 RepID=A0ABS4GN20_9BACL|nr:pyridoxal phosphate-dependent aminotransferase [Ammoniphilus resinae]MBP1931664.1 aspartate/methionine/tyrosine aminotransferase [Ammoniphilus resinae]